MSNTEANLGDLLLDLKNPRFDGLSNQREALQKIIQSQGSKLVNLAEDIVENGMSPAHRMLVVSAKVKGESSYVVVDGNRRLATLRVLANPAVLDGLADVGTQTITKLKTLARKFRIEAVEPLDVFVCKSEVMARHWIEAIHTGENDGRGVVAWDGIATARYRGKNSSLKVIDFVKALGKLTSDELTSLERFPITNLDRLLGTPEIRELLGLSLDDGELLTDIPVSELLRSLKRIVTDLASKKVNVGALKGKEDRLNYIKSLKDSLPDLKKRTGTREPLDQLILTAKPQNYAKAKSSPRTRSLTDRSTLIPSATQVPLNISDHKLQQMAKELRKLPLDTYPVAVAASFRVFLEITLDFYGTHKKVKDYSVDLSLKKKIEIVGAALESNGLKKRDLQSFRALGSNQNVALSIDRLHGVIHSRYALPTPTELRNGWSEVEFVFTKIWE
jgi:hypothetical protein